MFANLLILKLCSAQSADNTPHVYDSSELTEQNVDSNRSLTTLIVDKLIDILFRINWPALFVKLLKTLVSFMIDVAAGAFFGRSSLTSPLTSF